MHLPINAEIALTVDPRERYQDTELKVNEGERYVFTASGLWADASRICGPEGWSACWTAPLLRFSRVPEHNFFYLCGNIGRVESSNFPIGSHKEVTISSSGQLYLFPNDIWYLYFNNHALPPEKGGPMNVNIRRVA